MKGRRGICVSFFFIFTELKPTDTEASRTLAEESTESSNEEPVSENDFIIPELPSGQELVIDITSTWGDKHYLGLNGIEIFNSDGEQVKVQKVCLPYVSCRLSLRLQGF